VSRAVVGTLDAALSELLWFGQQQGIAMVRGHEDDAMSVVSASR